jgi:VWFA-related protein
MSLGRTWVVSVSMGAAVLAGGSQQPAENQEKVPVTTLNVQAREVLLPVTVRDKKGQVISSLKQEDFVLEQDGRPQSIKSFAHDTNLPFRLGLLVDTSRSQENALPAERAATGKFIDQILAQPVDKGFLLHFDHEVELLQDFTTSKPKLHHELEAMSTSTGGSADRAGTGDPDEKDSRGGGRRRGGGTQLYDAIFLASNELMMKQPGKKAVIVLSDGVDRGSRESLSDAVDAAEKANVSVYTVYFKGEEDRDTSRPDMEQRRGGMGGGGYPGRYPGGGSRMPRPGSGEQKVDGKKILEQIARRTGGVSFEAKKKDSFDEVYAQIAEELKGQYLLTYTPDKPASKDDADGFHKISLKAKDEKYVVTTREGYYSQD